MPHSSTITSLSWIPSQAAEGGATLALCRGFHRSDDLRPARRPGGAPS